MSMQHRSGPPSSPLEQIQQDLGKIARELASVNTNVSGLHVKSDIIAQSFKRLADDRMRDRFDIERYGRRIQAMEHQLALMSQQEGVPDWQPDPREITGTHDFAVVKAQFEEMRARMAKDDDRKHDSGVWWRRQRYLWAVALLMLVLTSVIGCGSALLVNQLVKPAAPTATPTQGK